MTGPSSEELREAIAREEARVARLDDERRLAQSRLDALRKELAALGTFPSKRRLSLIPEPTRPETSAEKVSLSRQTFRGRDHDGLHPILEMQLGPLRFAVDAKSQAARRPFEHRLIVRDTTFVGMALDPAQGIHTLYAALAEDARRNRLILDDVVQADPGRAVADPAH